MNLHIVLPTYQERDSIEPLVRRIFSLIPGVHILVVDDSSPDGTAAVVEKLRGEYTNLKLMVRPRKEGLGRAYMDGFQEVFQCPDADWLLTMDADSSHDPEYIPAMIEQSSTHDVVIGSRYTNAGGIAGWEFWRRTLSSGGNLYSRSLTGMPIADCTSGFMLMRISFLRQLDFSRLTASGYAFLMELKYYLWRQGASIVEVPIIFKNRLAGESKISSHIISEGIRTPWRLRWGGK